MSEDTARRRPTNETAALTAMTKGEREDLQRLVRQREKVLKARRRRDRASFSPTSKTNSALSTITIRMRSGKRRPAS